MRRRTVGTGMIFVRNRSPVGKGAEDEPPRLPSAVSAHHEPGMSEEAINRYAMALPNEGIPEYRARTAEVQIGRSGRNDEQLLVTSKRRHLREGVRRCVKRCSFWGFSVIRISSG